MLQSWLELNGGDCRRAPDIENVDCPVWIPEALTTEVTCFGEVVHMAVSLSGDRNLLLIAHELARPRRNPQIYTATGMPENLRGRDQCRLIFGLQEERTSLYSQRYPTPLLRGACRENPAYRPNATADEPASTLAILSWLFSSVPMTRTSRPANAAAFAWSSSW